MLKNPDTTYRNAAPICILSFGVGHGREAPAATRVPRRDETLDLCASLGARNRGCGNHYRGSGSGDLHSRGGLGQFDLRRPYWAKENAVVQLSVLNPIPAESPDLKPVSG